MKLDKIPVYIYALCEPETLSVRYIGQTSNLYSRIQRHKVQCGENQRKEAWIKAIYDDGKRPTVVVLDMLIDPRAAADAEIKWIEHYRQQGADLFNTKQNRRSVILRGLTAKERIEFHVSEEWDQWEQYKNS